MKRIALIAALMLCGSAFAQTASTSDPTDMTTPDTAIGADTTVETDMDAAHATAETSTTSDATMAATGVGGPYEAANAPTSKGGYPPCDPGPGDDMCIQLYEPGVSTSTNLAMNRRLGDDSTRMANAGATSTWTNETTATTSTETGVGGPYEPVTTEASDAAGTDYPACDPGPGDDDCIQLYERGVTGDVE